MAVRFHARFAAPDGCLAAPDGARMAVRMAVSRLDHSPRSPAGRAVPEAGARPTGVGRAIATYDMPIESRGEWLAAARRLA